MLGSIVSHLADHVITSWAIFDMGSHFADHVITLQGLPYWIIHRGYHIGLSIGTTMFANYLRGSHLRGRGVLGGPAMHRQTTG